jgi:hypothetical protein
MRVRFGRAAWALLAWACWPAIPALAQAPKQDPEPGDGSIQVHVGLFDMPDGGEGNPFLDEELTVIEGIVVYDYQLNEKLGLSTLLTYDFISSASIDRLSKFPDQTGASGDYYIGADVGFRYALSDREDLGWHLGGSVEYDYTSIGLGGSYSVEAADRNSSWTYSLEAFIDTIDVIRFDGTEEGTDDRVSLAATISRYAVIDPKTHGELGLTLSSQTGFLETAYNAVVLEDPALPPNPNLANNARGIEITEELPDSRTRAALFGQVRRSLGPQQSLELGGRLYTDSWGIDSLTLEPRYYRSLAPPWLLRLRYRFYLQTAADDFEETFLQAAGTPDERTQDSDLGDFESNTFGVKLDWSGKSSTWSTSLDYVLRSNGLDQLLFAIGWSRSF